MKSETLTFGFLFSKTVNTDSELWNPRSGLYRFPVSQILCSISTKCTVTPTYSYLSVTLTFGQPEGHVRRLWRRVDGAGIPWQMSSDSGLTLRPETFPSPCLCFCLTSVGRRDATRHKTPGVHPIPRGPVRRVE